mmetsp:Transcript_15872/g.38290  ORF Transcript_15872/g.38290 Transcript_15872/m.38290 type:complete len:111 (-) Transcript_15872:147-479(-)
MPRSVAGVLLVLVLALSLMSADARGPGRRLHVDDDGMEFNDAQEAPSQRSWPHLVGEDGHAAKQAIEEQHPDLNVKVVPSDAMMTMDYREDRVRVIVDSGGKVARPPKIG